MRSGRNLSGYWNCGPELRRTGRARSGARERGLCGAFRSLRQEIVADSTADNYTNNRRHPPSNGTISSARSHRSPRAASVWLQAHSATGSTPTVPLRFPGRPAHRAVGRRKMRFTAPRRQGAQKRERLPVWLLQPINRALITDHPIRFRMLISSSACLPARVLPQHHTTN